MKTCTNCGKRQGLKEFAEHCGNVKIVFFMRKMCRNQSDAKTSKSSGKLIKTIGRKLLNVTQR